MVRAGDEVFAAYTAGYADPRLAITDGEPGGKAPAGRCKKAKAANKQERARAPREG